MSTRRKKPQVKKNVDSPSDSLKEDVASETNTGLPWMRMLSKGVLVAGTTLMLYLVTRRESPILASNSQSYDRVSFDLPCSKDYEEERLKFHRCAPTRCSRIVMDKVVERNEAQELLKIAKKGLSFGGSNGGASILDLHSGALSKGDQFINIYTIKTEKEIFSNEDFNLYKRVKNKIHAAIASEFDIPKESLFLTKPTFFSRMNTKPAKTIHDEYWHSHIDKKTYGSFHYTSLLYLTDYGQDFTGGRFIFVDKDTNRTVEPKLGRVSFFTSGSENVHYVEKLESGTRYAITVSFTCDPDMAIADPELRQQAQ